MRARGSDQYESILELIPDNWSDPNDSLEQVEAKFAMVHWQDPGPGVSIEPDEHGVWVRPADGHDDRVVLFAHGGGFVTSPAESYTFWGAHVARRCGVAVLIADYRLAPATTFPSQLDDLAAAHDALLDGGCASDRIVFMGDSCGGGLAVGTMLTQRDRGRPQPGAFVGLGGWYDLEATGVESPWPDPFVNPDWLRLRGRDYVGPDGDPADPRASVVNASLAGLAPMLLQTGEVDPCLPGARTLARHADRDEVPVEVEVVPAVAQGFQGMGGVPEADQAWASVKRFVDTHVPPG